jgi:hypothetical protein
MTSDADERVQAALRDVFDAFAAVEAPTRLDYCSYCDTEAYVRALLEPRTTLPRELVDKYLHDAIHHTGNATDFLYFLPRILELEAEASLDAFAHLAERLKMASFDAWPDARRAAVLRAVEAMAAQPGRDVAWYVACEAIPGLDWDAIFLRWPGHDGPWSDAANALEDAIYCHTLALSAPSGLDAGPLDARWCAFLDSPVGAAFAAAHLARRG